MSERITICSIFKNEEEFIPGFLECFLPYGCNFQVLDTGSTDSSVKLFESAGITPGYFEWCDDFGKARTASLQKVETPWLLVVDMDDRILENTWNVLMQELDNLSEDVGSLALRYRNLKFLDWRNHPNEFHNEQMRCMFFRSNFNLQYRGSIHEDPIPSIYQAGLRIKNSDQLAYHLGYAGDLFAQKGERNREYLLREYESGNRSSRLLYYISSLFGESDLDKARICVVEALESASGEIRKKLLQRAILFGSGEDESRIQIWQDYVTELHNIDSNDPVLVLSQARSAFESNQASLALQLYQGLEAYQASELLKPHLEEIHYRIAFCFAALGELQQAYDKLGQREKQFSLNANCFHLRLKLALALQSEKLIDEQLRNLPREFKSLAMEKKQELIQFCKLLGTRADVLFERLKESGS